MRVSKPQILFSPLPPPDHDPERDGIILNGMFFKPVPGVKYQHNYIKVWQKIQDEQRPEIELELYRKLFLNDLFFAVYFVYKCTPANNKFCVDRCREIEEGSPTNTLDLWAREHFKSTILTIVEPVQQTLKGKVEHNRDESTLIMSYSDKAAQKFLRSIKYWLESSDVLRMAFPDCLFSDPAKQTKWSEETGLFIKRNSNMKEPTFATSGLVEGMATGSHNWRRIYDDVETMDIVKNPDQIEKLIEAFNMSEYLGMDGGVERVIGTYYHYAGLLTYLESKKDENDKLIYQTRKYPATENGEMNGESVLIDEHRLSKMKADVPTFCTQMLMRPTRTNTVTFKPEMLLEVSPGELPRKLWKFLVVDPAGDKLRKDKRTGNQDPWAIGLFGVRPYRDNLGMSDIYILDMVLEAMEIEKALKTIVEMYMSGGRVLKLGVEKHGLSTTEIHIASALRAKHIHITEKNGRLQVLSSKGEAKDFRIESYLSTPFTHGKIKIVNTIPRLYIEKYKLEMEKFPLGKHDDGLDMTAYLYQLIKDYRFPEEAASDSSEGSKLNIFDKFDRAEAKKKQRTGWMVA